MAKKTEESSLLAEMGSARLYKRNQGRLTRQLTAVVLGVLVFFGIWTLHQGPLSEISTATRYGISWGLAIAAAWFIFRLVHYPPFADFLISVEAEMDKVTWASRRELKRSTIVVIITMLFLGTILFAYDMFWQWFFRLVGFLQF